MHARLGVCVVECRVNFADPVYFVGNKDGDRTPATAAELEPHSLIRRRTRHV